MMYEKHSDGDRKSRMKHSVIMKFAALMTTIAVLSQPFASASAATMTSSEDINLVPGDIKSIDANTLDEDSLLVFDEKDDEFLLIDDNTSIADTQGTEILIEDEKTDSILAPKQTLREELLDTGDITLSENSIEKGLSDKVSEEIQTNDTVRLYNNDGSGFSGEGEGTLWSPYQIRTAEQFNEIRNNLRAWYVLEEDIDLSIFPSWEPIGSDGELSGIFNENEVFKGHIDGKDHIISGLKLNNDSLIKMVNKYKKSDEDFPSIDFGLFGYAAGNITNLHIRNCSVDIDTGLVMDCASFYCGVLVGRTSGEIENCSVEGSFNISCSNSGDDMDDSAVAEMGAIVGNSCDLVAGCNSNVEMNIKMSSFGASIGGIIGRLSGDCIGCVNNGNISIYEYSARSISVGGIVSVVDEGDIYNCTNRGNIKCIIKHGPSSPNNGTRCAGGIIGEIDKTTVKRCSNYGNIYIRTLDYWDNYAGGIVGYVNYGYIEGDESEICYCINGANTIDSIIENDTSVEYSYAYRICEEDTDAIIKENYSVSDIRINGELIYADREADVTTESILPLFPVKGYKRVLTDKEIGNGIFNPKTGKGGFYVRFAIKEGYVRLSDFDSIQIKDYNTDRIISTSSRFYSYKGEWCADFPDLDLSYGTKYYFIINTKESSIHDFNMNKESWTFTTIPNPNFSLGKNNNDFIHNNKAGGGFEGLTNYKIDKDRFYDVLGYATSGEIATIIDCVNGKIKWGGSCFGIAATQGMVAQNRLGIKDLSTYNKNDYFSIGRPVDDTKLLYMINYYYLTQFPRKTYDEMVVSTVKMDGKGKVKKGSLSGTLQSLISMLDKNKIVEIGYRYNDGGHAVLAVSYTFDPFEEVYDVLILDCNSGDGDHNAGNDNYSHFYIKKDFSGFSYPQPGPRHTEDNIKELILFDLDKMVTLGNSPEQVTDNNYYKYILFNTDISYWVGLRDSVTGKTLEYDGDDFGGTMDIEDVRYIFADTSDGQTGGLVIAAVKGSGNYDIETNDNNIDVAIFDNDDYVSLSLQGADSANIKLGEGTYVNGEDYDFDIHISSKEKVDDVQNALMALEGHASSDLSVSLEDESIHISSKDDIQPLNIKSYIGLDTISIAESITTRDIVADSKKQHTSMVKGDVTGDGDVAMGDVLKVAKAVAGTIELTPEEAEAADVTGDNEVAMGDVLKISKYVAGTLKEL